MGAEEKQQGVFNRYGKFYDALYADKNYSSEVEYIAELISKYAPHTKTILDVGCGTGQHAYFLGKKGFEVSGIDQSAEMVDKAKATFPNLSFYQGDGRNFDIARTFDCVTSLFHVASYQRSNADFENYLAAISRHINPGGSFLFDFWYGPGVYRDPPQIRIKRIETKEFALIRIAEPQMNTEQDCVTVKYEMNIIGKGDFANQRFEECHEVRYFFMPEIEAFLRFGGYEIVNTFEWMKLSRPTDQSWYACVLARKKK